MGFGSSFRGWRRCIECRDLKPLSEFGGENRFCERCRTRARVGRTAKRLVGKRIHRKMPHVYLTGRPVGGRKVQRWLQELALRRFKKGRIKGMPKEQYAKMLQKLPDRIAAIIGKSYAEMGDSAEFADNVALMMIRDLLLDCDPTLVERNKSKKVARVR
jgi:hypothetical protein